MIQPSESSASLSKPCRIADKNAFKLMKIELNAVKQNILEIITVIR